MQHGLDRVSWEYLYVLGLIFRGNMSLPLPSWLSCYSNSCVKSPNPRCRLLENTSIKCAVHHKDNMLAQFRPFRWAQDGDQGIQLRHIHPAYTMPPGQTINLDAYRKLKQPFRATGETSKLCPVGAVDTAWECLEDVQIHSIFPAPHNAGNATAVFKVMLKAHLE